MRHLKRITICVAIILLNFNMVAAQDNSDKSGTTVAQFLKIGVGGRAMGMAGAYTANANDVYSLYWNPAGITKIDGVSLAVVNTEWFADMSHQFLGFVLPVSGSSAVGAHVIVLNMDAIEITTLDEPHGTGEFYDAADLAIGVSYAARMTNYFSVGITGKYINQKIYNESASTFAFDIGSQLDVPFHGLKLGMNFSNFGGKMQLDGRDLIREYDLNPFNTNNDGVEARLKTEPWELPVNFAIGLSMDVIGGDDGLVKHGSNRMILSLTGNHPADAAEFASMGMEYIFNRIISARVGYRLNRDVERFFYGLGLNVPLGGIGFGFDYSLASFEDLEYVHIISAQIEL